MEKQLQLKIELVGSEPKIWRRILMPTETTFKELHWIIQFAFEWTSSHLHEFNVGKYVITNDEYFEEDQGKQIMADTVELGASLMEGQVFTYLYDFGDYWEHQIKVEKIIESETKEVYCTEGDQSGALEDCGGIHGYYNLLKILKDKKHPEHEEMKEWAGGEFDSNVFDKTYLNKLLKNLDEEIREAEDLWDF